MESRGTTPEARGEEDVSVLRSLAIVADRVDRADGRHLQTSSVALCARHGLEPVLDEL